LAADCAQGNLRLVGNDDRLDDRDSHDPRASGHGVGRLVLFAAQ